MFRSSGQFAVNILANDQKAIATQFATRAVDKFAGVDLIKGLGGLPLIAGAAAHLECEVEQRYPGGDHELIIGRVLHAVAHGQTPLVYAQGLFGDFLAASEEIGK